MKNNDKLKEEVIKKFSDIIKRSDLLGKYIDSDEISRRLNENIISVSSEHASYLPSKMYMAACLGRNVILRPNTKLDSATVFHEMLHMLTSKFSKQNFININQCGLEKVEFEIEEDIFSFGIDRIDESIKLLLEMTNYRNTGKGINEGITQYLSRKTVPENSFRLLDPILFWGLEVTEDGLYPLEQTLAEELIILYGEAAVFNAYLNSDPNEIIKAIGESGAISEPEEKYEDFRDLIDSLNEVFTSGKGYLLKGEFLGCQDFFISEFLEKEAEKVLESRDSEKISEMRDKLWKLLNMNCKVDGKNVFNDTVARFNEKVRETDKDLEVPDYREKFSKKIKRKIQKTAGVATAKSIKVLNCMLELPENLRKRRFQKLLSVNENSTKSLSAEEGDMQEKNSDSDSKLLEEIRGFSENEYEENVLKSESEWAKKHGPEKPGDRYDIQR